QFRKAGLNVWTYTGYTFEYIINHIGERHGWKELIDNIDVMVDGKFEKDNMEEGLRFRGSKNQRIIDVRESLRKGEIIEVELSVR
ncbi:MAG: 4Fe-4S cluster-binding domain-containing protein, partial [Clostridiaceae bacterium]